VSQTIDSLAPGELPARVTARAIDVLLLVGIGGALGRQIGFGFDWLITTAVIVILYFVVADAATGTTAGKAVLRLRVIGPDRRRPTLKQAFIRESFILLGAIPFVGPLLALTSWVWILLTIRSSKLRQGKHDVLAGGTRVIRASS
jgi:uncharacterized RDD family membrane protein YckC